MGGGIALSALKDITGIDLTGNDLTGKAPTTSKLPHNLSAWVIDRIGKVPVGSEVISGNGVRALVRKVRRQRVLEVAIQAIPVHDYAT